MGRYIDAEKILPYISRLFGAMPLAVLKMAETDGIDIVHCINCKFCSERGGHANCNGYLFCTRQKMLVDETCYCSWGEER